jgi:uncharacterized protein involved in exopolysaccharide biosynthesis
MSTTHQILTPRRTDPASANGHDDRLLATSSEPLLAKAIARRKWLVIALGVLCAAIGVGVGLAHKSTYTASSTLQIGKENPNSPSFYGYVQSASALAAVYSRALTAEPVLAEIQHKLGITPDQAIERLSAEPIPNSPVFRAIATGPSERSAVALANVAAAALVSYESHNNYTSDAAELYASYQTASEELARAKAHLANLASGRPKPEDPPLISAQAAVFAAQAHSTALAAAYQQAITAQPSGSLVTPLAYAINATNDKRSKVELIGFVGLIGGLLIGGAIAVLREQRREPFVAV